jgi:hypothetical protein
MCNVNYNEKRHIDSFYNYFSNYKSGFKEIIIEIIDIILGIPLFFFNKYFSTLVIKYLSPVHVIFSIPIIFLLEKIVMITNTLIIRYFSEKKEGDQYYAIFSTNKKNSIITKFYLDISGDIFSLIGFLIYLEIIRLKCRKFYYNTKTNIIKRGNVELMNISVSSVNSSDIDKSQDDKDLSID